MPQPVGTALEWLLLSLGISNRYLERIGIPKYNNENVKRNDNNTDNESCILKIYNQTSLKIFLILILAFLKERVS